MTNGTPSRELAVRQKTTELQRLVSSRTELSSYKATTALDAIADSLHEDEFRALVRAEVSPADIAALLSGRFDLVSSAMLAAEPKDVVAAIVEMAVQHSSDGWRAQRIVSKHVFIDPVSPDLLFNVLSCAEYLKARSDWDELREVIMALDLSFGDWVVLALWFRAGRPRIPEGDVELGGFGSAHRGDDSYHDDDDDDTFGVHRAWDVTADVFDEVGLDMTDALDRLRELIADGRVPQFSSQEFVEARRRFAERQSAVHSAAQEARDAADKVAGDVDL